jgi:hypothetical protein
MPERESTAQRLLLDGCDLIKKKQYRDAVNQFTVILSQYSETPQKEDALHLRGFSYAMSNQYRLALNDYQQCCSGKQIKNDNSRINYVHVKHRLKIYDEEGLKDCAAGIEILSSHPQAYLYDTKPLNVYFVKCLAHLIQKKEGKAILQLLTPENFAPVSLFAYFADAKEVLFEAILQRPREEQENLLKDALNKESSIGKIFWMQRGFFAPKITSGTLKKLARKLSDITGTPAIKASQPALSPLPKDTGRTPTVMTVMTGNFGPQTADNADDEERFGLLL